MICCTELYPPPICSHVAKEIIGPLNLELVNQTISFHKAPYRPLEFTAKGTPTAYSGCEQFRKKKTLKFVTPLKKDSKNHGVWSSNLHKV